MYKVNIKNYRLLTINDTTSQHSETDSGPTFDEPEDEPENEIIENNNDDEDVNSNNDISGNNV